MLAGDADEEVRTGYDFTGFILNDDNDKFYGQASDRVWFFPHCSFKASRRKKKEKRKKGKKRNRTLTYSSPHIYDLVGMPFGN